VGSTSASTECWMPPKDLCANTDQRGVQRRARRSRTLAPWPSTSTRLHRANTRKPAACCRRCHVPRVGAGCAALRLFDGSASFGAAGTSASSSSKYASWWDWLTSPAGPVLKCVRWPPSTWLRFETSWLSCKRSNEIWRPPLGAVTRPAPGVGLSIAPFLKTWPRRATPPCFLYRRHRTRRQARAAVDVDLRLGENQGKAFRVFSAHDAIEPWKLRLQHLLVGAFGRRRVPRESARRGGCVTCASRARVEDPRGMNRRH